ncbi:flagellar brake protein [endosymbiont of Lamellibrachia barhami]|uniref:flagellar brake protein n=1 Tax=endosymbiont of Lamellibrachia barhami TaxID=205975 RepID=UPI0015B093FC|nr:flagellar brake protein [endosymbiont of Lamellibrachia barhami]
MSDIVTNLQIGEVLQLQYAPPSENQDRYAVKLIGYLPGESLVITTPRKQGKAILVREGQMFTVRVLQGSNIFGFVAKVLQISSKPYPHLHLAYPEEVESAVVRNAPRVHTSLQSVVRNTKNPDDSKHVDRAKVLDLSRTGARLSSEKPLGKLDETLQLQLSIKSCDGDDVLQLLGIIRTVREVEVIEGKTRYIHGLEFSGLNRFQQVLLCAFVLGQMVHEHEM